MTGRVLYLARHGEADVFGTLSAAGRAQSDLLGRRIAHLPVTAVWHSPLARAADCARELARHLPGVPVAEAAELIDHVPYVPTPEETPPSWRGFFDGYDESETAAGQAAAAALVARFGTVAGQGSRQGPPQADGGGRAEASRHEVLITHAYPIAWLLRDALGAPPDRWLGLSSAPNAALTVIAYGPSGPPAVTMVNDQSHLSPELRWTGFGAGSRP